MLRSFVLRTLIAYSLRERDFLKAVSSVSFSAAVARLEKGQDIPL